MSEPVSIPLNPLSYLNQVYEHVKDFPQSQVAEVFQHFVFRELVGQRSSSQHRTWDNLQYNTSQESSGDTLNHVHEAVRNLCKASEQYLAEHSDIAERAEYEHKLAVLKGQAFPQEQKVSQPAEKSVPSSQEPTKPKDKSYRAMLERIGQRCSDSEALFQIYGTLFGVWAFTFLPAGIALIATGAGALAGILVMTVPIGLVLLISVVWAIGSGGPSGRWWI